MNKFTVILTVLMLSCGDNYVPTDAAPLPDASPDAWVSTSHSYSCTVQSICDGKLVTRSGTICADDPTPFFDSWDSYCATYLKYFCAVWTCDATCGRPGGSCFIDPVDEHTLPLELHE